MILIDFSQVMIANLMMNLKIGRNTGALQPDFLRHMILNTLRAVRTKFPKALWGELVLACDGQNLWRADVFEHYKYKRKKARSDDSLDWEKIYEMLDTFRNEIHENFPYRVIFVPKCEGDDVIATLCIARGSSGPLNTGEPIKIVSGDTDFMMLQAFGNVSQYDQIHKKDIICANPELERKTLIFRGDSGDGVPNVLSQDDCFVKGIKQRPLRTDKLEEFLNTPVENLPDDIQKNYRRNEALVDLFKVPELYQRQILQAFDEQANKPRDKILPYLATKHLRLLMTSVGEF